MISLNRRHSIGMVGAALATVALPVVVEASDLKAVPDARVVGKGRYSYLGIAIFDATLYAPGGRFDPNKPFALRLTYLKSLKGAHIADRSIEEIRKQGFADGAKLDAWRGDLINLFPNVSKGSSITGVRDANGAAHFFHDSKSLGSIDDSQFSRHFFDIWLGPKSSSKALRAQLLGQS